MLATHLIGVKEDWALLLGTYSASVKQSVNDQVSNHTALLAKEFYQGMLAHPEARLFLSHDIVHERLSASMQRWLKELFDPFLDAQALESLIEAQITVGAVHGKIDIPVHLVSRGGRMLKSSFSGLAGVEYEAYCYFSAMVDIALEVMSVAYHKNYQRNTREEEAYRLFSVTQDIGREREAQRASLLDWENEMLFEHAMGSSSQGLVRIEQSEFGLWFRHKGLHAFEGAPECAELIVQMELIDNEILPQMEQSQTGTVDFIRQLRGVLRKLIFLLDSLFEHSEKLESGKDALTRLLNRKFLPAVMNRQLTIARQRNEQYGVLIIDVDHFKHINDTYGHDNGDRILQQVALSLTNSVRSGDYTFRLGGEEFMVLLVDVNQDSCNKIAEKVRQAVAKDKFLLADNVTVEVTVSIGAALYSGHPDYQYDLNCADKALYHAKRNGRNCVSYWHQIKPEPA